MLDLALQLFVVCSKACGLAIVLLLLRAILWLVNLLLIAPLSDPLKNLPGPPGSFFQNHFDEVMNPKKTPETHRNWVNDYGKTFAFHGFGKHDLRLMTFDFRVITHVLSSPAFEKPWQTRSLLTRLIGRGIFSMEGAEHKMQRRIISPAFSTQSVKNLAPIYFQKAKELCDKWEQVIHESKEVPQGEPKVAGANIDVAHWISRASFDVIGLGGFDYLFNALHDESETVYMAYRRMFNISDKGLQPRGILELYFPFLRKIWRSNDTKTINESLRHIDHAGRQIISQKKAKIQAEIDTQDTMDKDILSLLIKSNLSADPSKRMSDKDLLDQCSTFLLAGSDSVSVAVSWCLHFLATYPEIQERLRQEIISVQNCKSSDGYDSDGSDDSMDSGYAEEPSMRAKALTARNRAAHCDALESLPFLDGVTRETLRVCPPVHATIRVATADDQIPTSQPITVDGKRLLTDYIKIRKGSYIHIPIEGLNYSEEIWGPDAQEFNPERWSCLPPQATSPTFPGLGNLMTFGYGPHSCLGYKFTIVEMKIFIAVLLPRFNFSLIDGVEISKFNSILTRPYVVNHWDDGTQLPLKVERRN